MAIPNVSTTSYPTARFGAIGQSLAAFLYYSYAGYAFKSKFAEIMRGSGNSATVDGGIEIGSYATGGSFASQANKNAAAVYNAASYDGSSVHWNDTSANVGYGTGPGYASVAAIARASMLARNASNKVVHLLADQGQADAVCAAGLTSLTPVQGADNWYSAWGNLIPGYREYLDSSTTGKIAWMMLGRSLSLQDAFAYERIRQKQLALIAANSSAMFKAAETWDLELGDSVHPSIVGQTTYGYRLAEMVAKTIYGVNSYTDASGATVTIYAGPTIASVTKTSTTSATVTLASDSGDAISMPTRSGPPPCGFAFWDTASNMDAVFSTSSPPPIQRPTGDWSWSSSPKTLTLNWTTPITGTLAMAFPYDTVSDFDPATVIKGSTSSKPLQSWAR